MNPRDLPSVGAKLLIKLHAVISALKALNGGVGWISSLAEEDFSASGEEKLENSRTLAKAISRSFGLLLHRLLGYDAQLRSHVSRLDNLENSLA